MKFDKLNNMKNTFAICIAAALVLSGCSTVEKKPAVEVKQEAKLVKSDQLIPQQAYDETGKKVEFVAADNPYIKDKVRVDKGSVLLFIEAKKAWRKGDQKTAKQKLSVITKKDAELSGPWVMLGEMAEENGDLKQAHEHLMKALEINSNNVNAYTALAKVQRKQGRFNVAQNTLVTGLELWSDFPEAHYNLAVLYDIYLNKPELAQKHLEAFLFLTNGDAQSLEWFLQLVDRTGKTTSAVDSKIKQSAFIKIAQDAQNEARQ